MCSFSHPLTSMRSGEGGHTEDRVTQLLIRVEERGERQGPPIIWLPVTQRTWSKAEITVLIASFSVPHPSGISSLNLHKHPQENANRFILQRRKLRLRVPCKHLRAHRGKKSSLDWSACTHTLSQTPRACTELGHPMSPSYPRTPMRYRKTLLPCV